jgi:ankyrin repeat protein
MSNVQRFSSERPSLPPVRRRDDRASHTPADAIMPARNSALIPHVPDSTGTLDLSQVPPSALWLLDATVQANLPAWSESVRTIIFPAGMALVPEGIKCLTRLARVELPNFKGKRVDLRMSQPQPLQIAIGVESATTCISFLVPEGCEVSWMDEHVQPAWSTVEFDENGIPGQAIHHGFMRKQLEEGVDVAKSLLENVIDEKAFARMRSQFQFRSPSELSLLEETLCMCEVQTGCSLAQRAAQYGSGGLEKLIRFILARDDTPIAKQRFLIAAMQPDGVMVPCDVARELPGAIDEILKNLPRYQINREIIRASVGLFPRAPGGSPEFHELFREGDPALFREFVDRVVHASKCHEDMDILFYQDHAGRTIFHIAAETGEASSIIYLIEKISGKSWANSGSEISNILFLGKALKKKVANGDTAFWHAAARGEDAGPWIQSLMKAIDTMVGSSGVVSRELKRPSRQKLISRLGKKQRQIVNNLGGEKELRKEVSSLSITNLRRREDSTEKTNLLIRLLRIDRPRAADATVLKNAIEGFIITNEQEAEHQDYFRVVTDVLTFCGEGTTALHGYAKGNGSDGEFNGFMTAMFTLAASDRLSQIEVTKYLLSKDAGGATALHQFARSGARLTAFLVTILRFPAKFSLTPLWGARDASRCTPFWAVVQSANLSSFVGFILLMKSDTRKFNLDEQQKASLSKQIEESILKAGEEEIGPLLGITVAACMGGLSGLEAPVAFLFESIVSAKLNRDSKARMLSQALGQLPVDVLSSLAMRIVLAPLLQAKPASLTPEHKSLLLANMLHRLIQENVPRDAYVPMMLAISDASCSNPWKLRQQLKIDIACSFCNSDRATRLHLVTNAEQMRKTIEGWIALTRETEFTPQALNHYLLFRTQDGTALHSAVKRASPELVGALLGPLLAAGNALFRITATLLVQTDTSGQSAFQVALKGRHADIVAQFLGLIAQSPPFLPFIPRALAQRDAQEVFTDLLAVDKDLRTVFDVLIQAGDVAGLKLLLNVLDKAPAGAVQSVFKGLLATLERSHILWAIACDASSQKALGALMDWLCPADPAWGQETQKQLWAAFSSHRPLQRRLDRVREGLSPRTREQLPAAWSTVRKSQVATVEVIVEESPGSLLDRRQIDMEHSLNGKVTAQGEAVGGHALLNRHTLQIEAGTKVLHLNGTFTASVKIFNSRTRAWVAKAAPSTFFPEAWKEQDIVKQIASALGNGDEFGNGMGPWDRLSDSGVWIRFYKHLGTGKINCHPLPGFPPRES